MEISELIDNWRFVKEYLDKPVEKRKVTEILDSGRKAPSIGHRREREFIVIRDKEKIKEVRDACFQQDWITSAPVVIVLCANILKVKRLYGDDAEKISMKNSSMSLVNMLLTSEAFGLGSGFIGLFDKDKLYRNLSIPENVEVFSILTIGYSEREPRPPSRPGLENMVYFNKYGQETREE